MKKVNGIITEATEKELEELWSSSNWCKAASFNSFKAIMIEEGCNIIKGGKECENNFVEDVQQEISEQEPIVIVNQSKKEEPAVSDISGTHQKEMGVNIVQNEMNVKTEPQKEKKAKPSIIIIPNKKKE